MKNFFTVLSFEYRNYIRSRTFITVTVIMTLIILILSFLPKLDLASVFESDQTKTVAVILGDDPRSEQLKAIIEEGELKKAIPGYDWQLKTAGKVDPAKLIQNKDAGAAVSYAGGATYDFYASGSDLSAMEVTSPLNAFFTTAMKNINLLALPETLQGEVREIVHFNVTPRIVEVKGDALQNFFFAYVLIFLLYVTILMYGNFVINSVVTEKSSRTMELLITSARSSELMFGKVIAVALVALSQLILIILVVFIMLKLNLTTWEQTVPQVAGLFTSGKISPPLILAFAAFYLLGYFFYSFILAALGSTVSRVEDASSLSTIPILALVAALILAILGMSNPDSAATVVLSYIPFFTPMVMFARLCMGTAGPLEVGLGILDLLIAVLLMGFLAARIYRAGVMLYGKPANLKTIGQILVGKF